MLSAGMRDTHRAALYINVDAKRGKLVVQRVHRKVSGYLQLNVNGQHLQPAVCYHRK